MKLLNPVHPLKQKLKKLKIPQHVAAHNIGIGYIQFCRYLCGSCRMPKGVEAKIKRLIQDVESSR